MKPNYEAIDQINPTADFTPGEAARLLGMSHAAILARIHRKTLPAVMVGDRFFVKGADIQSAVQEKRESQKQKVTRLIEEAIAKHEEVFHRVKSPTGDMPF